MLLKRSYQRKRYFLSLWHITDKMATNFQRKRFGRLYDGPKIIGNDRLPISLAIKLKKDPAVTGHSFGSEKSSEFSYIKLLAKLIIQSSIKI